jgi:hypothetical protein
VACRLRRDANRAEHADQHDRGKQQQRADGSARREPP